MFNLSIRYHYILARLPPIVGHERIRFESLVHGRALLHHVHGSALFHKGVLLDYRVRPLKFVVVAIAVAVVVVLTLDDIA